MPIGRARKITVRATNEQGGTQDIEIARDGTANLADGTRVDFTEFRGSFRIGPEDPSEDTSAYPNPGAVLRVTQPGGVPLTAYAFGPQMASLPVAQKLVAGYKFQLLDFEKVSDQHILSVQRDPGANVVYVGFVMLFITLAGVFFFSHQRVWIAVDDAGKGTSNILIGGNTNRNRAGLEDRISKLIDGLDNNSKSGEKQ